MKQCCICGKMLPNKYAIGGACEHPDCADVFCRYHWSLGHRHCIKHGGSHELPKNDNKYEQDDTLENIPMNESNTASEAESKAAKGSSFLGKLTSGVKSIKKAIIKDPHEKLMKIEKELKGYEANRVKLIAELEEIDKQIIAKKKLYVAAPPFKKSILKSELETLLAQHANYERRIKTVLNNEKALSNYVSRIKEMEDIKDIPIKEVDVDILTGKLEDAVDDSVGIGDALKDLDKVKGVSSESMDADDLEQMLDMFGDTESDDIPVLDNFIGSEFSIDETKDDSQKEEPLKG